jgi:hypothetical protein
MSGAGRKLERRLSRSKVDSLGWNKTKAEFHLRVPNEVGELQALFRR